MRPEPPVKRAFAFVDGQNLFHGARQSFGIAYPAYDAIALARAVCRRRGWELEQVRFYTGVPAPGDDPFWGHFWAAKLGVMAREGAIVFTRPLRHRRIEVRLPDGRTHGFVTREEKGIDVRIAIDAIHLAHRREYDVALLFSQDQDLSEVAALIRTIAVDQGRWIKVASAYPHGARTRMGRGIDGTDWIRIDRRTYETCLDPRDYRPRGMEESGWTT